MYYLSHAVSGSGAFPAVSRQSAQLFSSGHVEYDSTVTDVLYGRKQMCGLEQRSLADNSKDTPITEELFMTLFPKLPAI